MMKVLNDLSVNDKIWYFQIYVVTQFISFILEAVGVC